MTRLAAVADRIAGQAFGLTNYNQLEADVNYLVVAGANLASAATINPTNEFHIVTGTATIDNLTDSLGQSASQQVRLLFQSALTIRNNGGGTGNIRTLTGSDRACAVNEVVAFIYDGTVWREVGKTPPTKYTSLIDIVSSVAETDILQSAGYIVPANLLGINGVLRARIIGDFLNNTGGAVTITPRVYFGGALAWNLGGASYVTSASRTPFEIEVYLSNLGATGSQFFTIRYPLLATPGGLPTGIGGGVTSASASYWLGAPTNTLAVDTTLAQTLRVTAQLGTSSASAELRIRESMMEVL